VLAVVALVAVLTPRVMASAATSITPVSDAFDAPATNTGLWSEVDPVGDGTVTQTGGGLRLALPGGVDHDAWTAGNRSLRAMQAVANVDVALEARFASRPTQKYTGEGILAEQDAGTYLRADWYSDGTTTRVFVASFAAGTPTVRANVGVATTAAPLHLRVDRSADTWTVAWSTNGSTFTTVTSFSFPMTLAAVGPFASNAGSPVPAWTATVDHFRNRLAPVVASVAVAPQETSATVTWTTDRAATSQVDWGTSDALGATAVGTPNVTSHAVSIAGLTCATTYRYRVVSAVASSDAEWWGNGTFTTSACGGPTTTTTTTSTTTSTTTTSTTSTTVPPSGAVPVSAQTDEFNGSALGSRWSLHAPAGGSASVTAGALAIAVPAGSSHEIWSSGNRGVRVMQAIGDGDFRVDAKLDTPLTSANTMQGFVVEQDDRDLLRLDETFDGTNRHVFGGKLIDGVGVTGGDMSIGPGAGSLHLRITRIGDTWTGAWSVDGSAFTTAFSFTHKLSAIRIGLWAGNTGGTAAPALTSRVDWFRVRSLAGSATASVANDDFNAGFSSSRWTFVNPDGSGGLAVTGGEARLTAASGTRDLAVSNNSAPRLLQTVANGDLDLEVKLSTGVTSAQSEGVVVEQSASRFLRFGVRGLYDGPSLYVALVDRSTGVTTVYLDRRVRGGATMQLRVRRRADAWTVAYSYDGLRWSKGVTFSLPLSVTRLGPYAATAGASSPFTARVDYVMDLRAPLGADDGVAIRPPSGPPTITPFYGSSQSFGSKGLPQRWFNVLGNVADPDGVAMLTYAVDGGREQGLWTGEDDSRLVEPGDWNAEIAVASLPAGSHSVRVTATDWTGARSSTTVTVTNAGGGPWPSTYSIGSWSAAPLPSLAQVVDGRFQVSGGRVRTVQTGYDRVLAIGDMNTWNDVEVTAQVTVHSLPARYGIGVGVGWKGHTSTSGGVPIPDQPRDGHPFPAWFNHSQFGDGSYANIFCDTPTKPDRILVKDTSGFKLTVGTTYMIRARADRTSATVSHYSMKMWPVGAVEPTSWLVQTDNDPSTGSIVLVAHLADVSWGPVTVKPV
jgi:regulation of enolase protein 1 (concanavalin A-like superfamily)